MDNLENAYKKLLRRDPTPEEISKLGEVQRVMGLRQDDALWLIFIALQSYQTHYEKIPHDIDRVAREALSGIRKAADAETRASVATAQADLAKAVATVAQKVAHDTAEAEKMARQTELLKMGSLAASLFAVLFCALFWIGKHIGYENGYAARSELVDAQKVAASWANTTEGQQALWLSKRSLITPAYLMEQYHGQLEHIFRCDAPGWQMDEHGICTVRPYTSAGEDRISSWKIPIIPE